VLAAAALVATQPPTADTHSTDPEADQIIVTGERVKRSLKDTQSSVYVGNQRDIEAGPADRVEQVLALIPNVQLGNGSEGPTIRGQDTTGALQALPAFMGGNRPRTTLIVDGRRDTYNEFVFGAEPAWDVDRIEVFRSPQTTTQGQNSIAGAIFVYTNDPAFQPEFRARLIGGNYDTAEFSALMSAPLSGDVALRISGDLRTARPTSRITDVIEGTNPNHDSYGVGRAKLLVKPRGLPDTHLLLTYYHNQSEAPQIVAVTQPFRRRRDEDAFFGVFRINVDALTAAAHQPLGSALVADLLVIRGVSDTRRMAYPGLGQSHIRGRDWSAEADFNWTPEGPLHAVGGVSRTHLTFCQFMDLSVLSGLGRFRDDQDSVGLFGEANFTIFPGATLTVGLRYQQDQQDRAGAFVGPKGSVSLDYDRTFRAWLPKLSLAYDFSPAVRAGALVQRAYNPGGTTLRFDTGRPDNFDAETLWDYEGFIRARLAAGLTASTNLFYYAMRNSQRAKDIDIIAPGGFGVGFSDLFNAPRAHNYGAEAELNWRASRRLSARFALGTLYDRIDRAGADYPEFEGKEFGRSPHVTATAAVDWQATARLRLSAQGRYHSAYGTDIEAADTQVEAATIVDARAEYRLQQFTLFGYARNLFDGFAIIERDAFGAVLEDPRMVGIGLEARF
jgi:outer membrane receptor protein involved in Fe transport